MSNNNVTPVLSGAPTPPLNLAPPSLNLANLSSRLKTLKRKSANVSGSDEKEEPAPSEPSYKNRLSKYARSKNVNVVWRTNPETGEAEMIKSLKPSKNEVVLPNSISSNKNKTGGRRTRKGKLAKSKKSKKSKGRRRH